MDDIKNYNPAEAETLDFALQSQLPSVSSKISRRPGLEGMKKKRGFLCRNPPPSRQ